MEKQVQGARLRALVEPAVTRLGFALVDVEYISSQKTLRVYIEGPDGIDVEDCARVSRQLSALFDVEDPIPGQYNLEVSSPGLDRPLSRPEDFARFVGAQIRVRTLVPVNGRRNFQGRLEGLSGECVVIMADETSYDLALANIDRARLVPDL
ncbi:MAG: ribosome maturation factor RimP [Acidiferrobacter sp.]